MYSSLEWDIPGTALLSLTEKIRIAPHMTQKLEVYYSDPKCDGRNINYKVEATQPWGEEIDEDLQVECQVMPGVSKICQRQQGRGGALPILAKNKEKIYNYKA